VQIDLAYAGMSKVGPVPFGVISLASILERAGHSVRVVDLDGQAINEESLKRHYRARRPEMIGITTMTTPTLARVARVADHSRRLFPESTIVVGGPHATIFPEEMLRELPVDVVVVGEGDLTVVELASALEAGADLSTVKGIRFKRNGSVIDTGPGPMLQHLDDLPMPAWHLVDPLKHYYVYIIESYGCPFRCTFCYTHLHGQFRTKSPARVVEDIEYMAELHGIRMFKFWDDLPFGGSKARMLEFCRLLAQRRLDVRWSCVTRPQVISDEVISAMMQTGCFRVSMGVETGSPRMLRLLNKDNRVETYLETFELLARYDILTAAGFMLGLPGEEREDLEMSIRLAESLRATEYFASNYKPYPGTQLYEAARENGFVPPRSIQEWAEYSDFTQYNVNVSKVGMDELIKAKKHIEGLTNVRKIYRTLIKAGLHQLRVSPWREARRFTAVGYNRFVKPRLARCKRSPQ
jgi:radical SAM superfamily enzyme YgiQ (UPF0313 family)